MATTCLSPDALLNLAKKQLRLSSPVAVPQAYIEELNKHIITNPHDTNFDVILQRGVGFGIATCLEIGCNGMQIALTKRTGASDGGRKDGLGALAAYRAHVEEHPTHKVNRHRRVKQEEFIRKNMSSTNISTHVTATSSGTSTPVGSAKPKRAGLLSVLDANFGATPSSLAAQASGSKNHAQNKAPRIAAPQPSALSNPTTKPEPAEPIVPRKRLEPDEKTPDGSLPGLKKAKVDVPRMPLAPAGHGVNLPILPPIPAMPRPAAPPNAAAALARERVSVVQAEIAGKQVSLQRALRKRVKSKADLTRIAKLEKQLKKLQASKDEYTRAIPSFPPAPAPSLLPPPAPAPPHAPPLMHPYAPSMNHLALQRPYGAQLPPQLSYTSQQAYPGVAYPHGTLQYQQPTYASNPPVASGSNVQLPTSSQLVPGLGPSAQAPIAAANRILQLPPSHVVNMTPLNTNKSLPASTPLLPGTSMYDDEPMDTESAYHARDLMVRSPAAKADDIEKFLRTAGNSEQFDGNARVEDALQELGLAGLYQMLPGMEVALMPHQAIGVAWMLDKEKGDNKGGCMSDEMGLGKTVQMIATIVSNMSDDPAVKTTLIVAPLALLDQWQLEIELKTNCDLKCLIYHGSGKPKKKIELMKYDVILTTFHTLSLEWPDDEAKERKQKAKNRRGDDFVTSDSEEDFRSKSKPKWKRSDLGLLFKMKFHRVVLDEAQNIRNRKTRISRAVTKLDAKYRWCLTGTPIINGLTDAYPLFRFLQNRPWNDWDDFNNHISRMEKRDPTLASTRLQAIFATMLIRRKKDSELDGKRLIDLPPKDVNLSKLQFSEEERQIYNMIEAKSQAVFNRYLREGTVLKNYMQVLVMLLRLRQICSHPSLIAEDCVAFIAPADLEEENLKPSARVELSRARKLVSFEFVTKMRYKRKQIVLQRIAAEKQSLDAAVEDEECPICYDTFTDPVVTACTHIFCHECITNVLNTPYVEDANEQIKYKNHERPCPSCRSAISDDKLFPRDAFDPTEAELAETDETVGGSPNIKMKDVFNHAVKDEEFDGSDDDMPDVADLLKRGATDKSKGIVKTEVKGKKNPPRRKRAARMVLDSEDEDEDEDEDDDMSDFIVQSDEDEDEKDKIRDTKKRLRKRPTVETDPEDEASEAVESEDDHVIVGAKRVRIPEAQIKLMPRFLPSTKMKHMMDLLNSWAEEFPDEKVLVISQWTQCLQLVSDYLQEKGIGHVKYQGDMNRKMRDQAVRAFMAKDKAKIMLMSLRCGGVGLNLTRANRVISLDLAWSEAVESQAFDRVHRLGQMRPVAVHRLVIENTVEDRVLALQDRKKSLADGSLGEGTGKKIGRLTVRELANLFGVRT